MDKHIFSVTFIVPPQDTKGDVRDLRNDILDSIGLSSITAQLEGAGYPVEYINADLLHIRLQQLICLLQFQDKPSLIGISIIENTVEMACRLIRALRENGFSMPIVAGGFFPTLAYQELMEHSPGLDYCILGEGEESCLELVKRLENNEPVEDIPGIVYRKSGKIEAIPPRIIDLDTLLPASKKYIPYLLERGGSGYVMTSRGCFSNCSFCSIKPFYSYYKKKSWRQINLDKIVDEIEVLNRKWDHRIIPLWDDNFLSGSVGKERAYILGEKIKQKQLDVKFFLNCRVDDVSIELFQYLKSIGLYMVGLGIENMSDKHLKLYGKGTTAEKNIRAIELLDKLGITTYLTFILFNPFTTIDDLVLNFNFFISRLGKETGYSCQNLLLTTISILGLCVGSRILKNKDLKDIITKKTFHYEYTIQDNRVELFKKIILFLFSLWRPLFSRLVSLEDFIFNPKYKLHVTEIKNDVRSLYNSIWKRLAKIHLFTCQHFLTSDSIHTDSRITEFCYTLNTLIRETNEMVADNRFFTIFPGIEYYIFNKKEKMYFFNCSDSQFININQIDKDILQNINLMNLEKIIKKFTGLYKKEEIAGSFQKLHHYMNNRNYLSDKNQLKEVDTKHTLRMISLIARIKK